MKFKKSLSLFLIMILIGTTSLSGCKSSSKDMNVALITSAAGANDKGYNQSAVEGLKKAKDELGIDYKVVETQDVPGSLSDLAGAGYKLIFLLEYNFDALINGIGGNKPIAEQYPSTTFVIFNDNPNVDASKNVRHKNVISIMFDVQQASFLAGALSVLVNENAATLFSPDKYSLSLGDSGKKVGFLGGTKSNGITVFSYGFAEGINYMAKDMNVKYTMYSDYNAGFSDSAAGATKANTYYSDGANFVCSVAGSVGDGVTAKAKEVKKFAIEVDANKDNNQPGYILTSILKNTEVPVYELVRSFKEGKISEKNGKELSYNLASGATGITDLSVIESNIMDSGKVKFAEIKNTLEIISQKIASGEIKVINSQAGEIFNKSNLQNLNMPND